MAVLIVLLVLFFLIGLIVGVVVVLAMTAASKNRGPRRLGSGRAALSAASLFDPTGGSVYHLARTDLEVRNSGSSAIETFQASARTVADAYEEATQGEQPTDVKSDSL